MVEVGQETIDDELRAKVEPENSVFAMRMLYYRQDLRLILHTVPMGGLFL